jgi:hypothetical protein
LKQKEKEKAQQHANFLKKQQDIDASGRKFNFTQVQLN